MKQWLDKNGLIKPQISWADSGNGLTYSVVYDLLWLSPGQGDFYEPILYLWDEQRGVLMRTPDNSYGQESHDNYTAYAIYCLKHGYKEWARECLVSAVRRFGFMQNDYKEKNAFWKSQMFRFPQIWIIMIAAAFPNRVVLFVCRALVSGLMRLKTANLADRSGVQLTFLLAHAAHLLGSSKPLHSFLQKIRDQNKTLAEVMAPYYSPGHPNVEGFANYENRF